VRKTFSPEAILVPGSCAIRLEFSPSLAPTNPERIAAACQADSIELDREEWYRLFTAGRGESLP